MSKKQLFFIIITCAIISCAVIITGMIYQTNQTMQKDLLQQTHLISIQTLQWDMASKLAMPISIVLISLILLITFLSASLPRLKTSIKPVQQRLMIPLTIILLLLSGGFYFFLITVQQYNPNMINRQLIVIILAIGLVLLTGLLGFLFVILRRTDKGIRKQQEDVRIKHNFAEDIINTAHAIILVLDKDGKIINFNPFMERISGYRLEEVKGNDWFTTFLPKKDLTKIRKVFNKSLKNIQVKGEVNPIITKDNRIIPIEWYDRPTRNSSGKISGILAIGIDVTERIKAQEMLYKKNKTLTIINELNKTVVNATDENELLQKTCKMLVEQGGYLLARIGYAKYDKDNTVRSIAQYGYEEKYFQITDITWNDEETGRCPMKVAIAQKKPIVDHDIQNNPLFAIWHKDAIKRGYKSSIALPLLDKEQCIGALNLYSKLPVTFDNDEIQLLIKISSELMYGIIFLRTKKEKLQISDAKEKMEKQLIQAQKMESIGTLAGGIAHDFNNILSAILGYSEMAMEDLPQGSQPAKDIEKVIKAGYRAKNLVTQILDFSRQTEHKVISLRVQYLVKEVLQLIRATLPSTIQIHQSISASCGTVLADPTQIHQIIMNLCTNASHAMTDSGGTLSIALKTVVIKDINENNEKIILPANTYVKLSVSDTGHGMSKEVITKIFDPFFTTKKVGEGTGMGLSVVHGIVKSYNGFIDVTSEPDKGTTISIFLPQEKTETQIKTTDTNPSPTGNENILIVDDEKELAEILKRMLESLGYNVNAFTNSTAALKEFTTAQPDKYDLVITDMTMPTLTGTALAKKIKSINPDIPIILCTGNNTLIDEDSAGTLEITNYIYKPIVKKQIAELIREALGLAKK